MSERIYEEPTREDLIECTKDYIKELQIELKKAKSYYTKLTIKQHIARNQRELQDLLENKDE